MTGGGEVKHIDKFPTTAVCSVYPCAFVLEVCGPSCAFQPERQQETPALGMQVMSALASCSFKSLTSRRALTAAELLPQEFLLHQKSIQNLNLHVLLTLSVRPDSLVMAQYSKALASSGGLTCLTFCVEVMEN